MLSQVLVTRKGQNRNRIKALRALLTTGKYQERWGKYYRTPCLPCRYSEIRVLHLKSDLI